MPKIDKTGDAAIMPLHKILMRMCGQTGYTPDAVFEGLLDYIIGYLNPSLTPEPIEGWKFKPKDTPTFHEMMQTVFRIYSEEIPRRRWYDPFGDLYMAIHAGGGGKGQFFTPPSVAQCVADVNIAGWDEPEGQPTPFGHRISLADHTGTKMVSIYPKVNGSVRSSARRQQPTRLTQAFPSAPVPRKAT
jgi:type I restriction enzyme M protein